MSEQDELKAQQQQEQDPVNEAGTEGEANDAEEGYGEEKEDGAEQEEEEEELYKNNHDLIGVDGIIRAQKNEIEKKKVSP